MLSGCDLGTGWMLPVIHARYSYTRHMSVRQNLLAILDQGPCYGYQLRAEFGRRTGSAWSLNVGQIYTTLERLERDGLVAKADIDEQGQRARLARDDQRCRRARRLRLGDEGRQALGDLRVIARTVAGPPDGVRRAA